MDTRFPESLQAVVDDGSSAAARQGRSCGPRRGRLRRDAERRTAATDPRFTRRGEGVEQMLERVLGEDWLAEGDPP
ncbi:hypothetical protein [Salipiger aestuarii]|uniref:hypothetical protein n=1 Tax=Salipiger aestuarii TaxID=568098 RepID=UPI00025B7DB3|nr:hypothetical protein [Salipiger aestuarii]EIE51462.1 hypothetical protein C357_08720 [Citreicella sp. 357]KAA8613222.1 hypothetical protein AL037_05760 [Salipiger aestuarii]KAB2543026.1 hypothetical protein AL035_03995 [Salipiger aestuarii]